MIAVKNNTNSFYGQQEGEKILAVVMSHPIGKWMSLAKMYAGAAFIWIGGIIISTQLPQGAGSIDTISLIIAIFVAMLATIAINKMEENAATYITNRRIVRFYAHNPFATSVRTLTWDQASKTKTFPQNLLYKMLMIGTVIVHAKATVINAELPLSGKTIESDDVELENVYYYKDLGNYIDKIIYLFNREPENLDNIKPFVAKPKGARY